MFISVIIVAAGKGKRFSAEISKQFFELDSKPVLAYAIEQFEKCKRIDEIVIVTGKEDIDYCRKKIVEAYAYKKVSIIVSGGAERQDSVYNGLCAISNKASMVLVHDGARPFVEIECINKLIEETEQHLCCVLGVKPKDTIKICDDSNLIKQTLNRNNLWIIQTPQAFRCDILKEAYCRAADDGFYGTDDAALVERIGYDTFVVEGKYSNIKITTIDDLAIGMQILKQREFR